MWVNKLKLGRIAHCAAACIPSRRAAFAATVALFAALGAQATDWYVATNGVDTASGSESEPVATIKKALSLSSGGDTIHIAAGTYAIAEEIWIYSAKNNISIVGEGETAADVVIDGQGTYRAFVVKGATGITFANFTIRNTTGTSASGILIGSNVATPTPITTAGNNLFSNLVFRACTNSNTSTSSGLYQSGGALFAASGDTVDHCVFEDCSGGYAGGVVADCSVGNVTFRSCEFRRCNSAALRGRNNATDGTRRLVLEDCVFEDNPARAGLGGGVSATGCTFARNSATEGSDGGVWYCSADAGTPYDFVGCTFSANTAARGGVFSSNPDGANSSPVLLFSNCTFRANAADTSSAVSHPNRGSVTLYGCYFEGNTAGSGGYTVNAKYLSMERCAFIRNVSSGPCSCADLPADSSAIDCRFEGNRTTDAFTGTSGSALRMTDNNTLVRNCLFLTNVNESAGGVAAAIYRTSKNTNPQTIEGSTFVGNSCRASSSDYHAAGIGAPQDAASYWCIVNCAFFDNKIGDDVRNLPRPTNNTNRERMRNACTNCFENATSTYALLADGANGNIVNTSLTTADLFADYAAGYLMPSKGSILRNAGVNRDWMTATAVDLGGKNLRINPDDKVDDSAIVDIGCYEFFASNAGLMIFVR